MSNLIVTENTNVQLDSDSSNIEELNIVVEEKASLIIKVTGHQKMELNIHCEVKENAQLSLLLLNSNDEELVVNDTYKLKRFSNATCAYSQLNAHKIVANSNYELLEEGAEIRVLSVSVNATEKTFNQNTNHLANHTVAHIDNYGVVLANGKTNLVVKNIVNRDIKNCDTHQTNRLLTYDKSAQGKVLPILCIDDNEVTASHACSLGQPDENQIYYLMTRGLSYDEALQLITIGYLMPITKIIDDEEINSILKEEIEMKVRKVCLN